jgi:hypothetical protein
MDGQRIDDAAQTLTEVRRLRARTRLRVHGGAWLPAAVLAVLVLLSAVLYRYPFDRPQIFTVPYPFWAGLPDEQRSATGSYAFWLLGLPAAFAAIVAWYRYRARRMGVRVPWPVLIAVGMGALLLLLALAAIPSQSLAEPVMLAQPVLLTAPPPPPWHAVASPLLAVAAAVVALGWVERSPGLAATGIWLGVLTCWQCASAPLTMMIGGNGPGIAGQLGLRPAGMLLAMAGPLLVWVLVQAVRSRGGTR